MVLTATLNLWFLQKGTFSTRNSWKKGAPFPRILGPENSFWITKRILGEFFPLCLLIGWISWSRGSAERIRCEIFILVWRILGRLPANFFSKFFPRNVWPCFSRASGFPQRFPPKLHIRTCQHSSPISKFRTQSLCRFSAYGGDQTKGRRGVGGGGWGEKWVGRGGTGTRADKTISKIPSDTPH